MRGHSFVYAQSGSNLHRAMRALALLAFAAFIGLSVGKHVPYEDETRGELREILIDVGLGNGFRYEDHSVELWPHFDALHHLDMFDQRTKKVKPYRSPDHVMEKHMLDVDPATGGVVTCSLCAAFMDTVLYYVRNDLNLTALEEMAINICIDFDIEDPRVCEGAVMTYTPLFEYTIDRMGDAATADLFCGLYFSRSCLHNDTDSMINDWTVDLPSVTKPNYAPPGTATGSTMKVLHMSDVHLDLSYLPGSNPDCGMPCCCMNSTGLAQTGELEAGYWGETWDCDLPLWTFDEFMRQIAANHGAELDFAFFTGDNPPHNIWEQDQSFNLEHSRAFFDTYKKHLPDVPLYFAMGNHEGFPVNAFPTSDETHPDYSGDWLYGSIGDMLADWLPQTAVDLFKQNGFYSVRPFPNLKIISVNNNFGAEMNNLAWFDFSDPAGHLAWLANELQDSEDVGEKVIILTHHPNKSPLVDGWAREYHKIVNRYENILAGTYVGHTHDDKFEVWYGDENVPTATTYVSPSLTPRGSKMPMYKIFTLDGGDAASTWQVVEADVYITHVSNHTDPNDPPLFTKFYTTTELYGMSRFWPEDWLDVLQRAMTDDQLYYYLYRNEDQNLNVNEPLDRRDYLCGKIKYVDPCPLV